jgi:hypothetical protein
MVLSNCTLGTSHAGFAAVCPQQQCLTRGSVPSTAMLNTWHAVCPQQPCLTRGSVPSTAMLNTWQCALNSHA